jgi:dimethylsulfoniopropionate demethylase
VTPLSGSGLNMSRRIRRTPYTDRVESHGVRGFTVVNHMLLPKAFERTVEEDYWHLREHVQIWDVSCQRQVEIRGPDAARLVQWMTPRPILRAKTGQCLYLPLVDEEGGMINDPVFLKLAEDRFWLSISDSDVLLWAKGLARGANMDVTVEEPPVAPLAIQGPRSADLMAALFGNDIRELGFFRFRLFPFKGKPQVIARTGFSRGDGFEIYLDDPELGAALWDAIWEGGQAFNIAPGCPNLIDRIEAGLLSYGNEMTRENNPFECGFEKYCQLDGSVESLSLDALREIENRGITRRICGLLFDGGLCPPCGAPWPVYSDEANPRWIGQVTSAIHSPFFERNVGLAMVERGFWDTGQKVTVMSSDGQEREGRITDLPFDESLRPVA